MPRAERPLGQLDELVRLRSLVDDALQAVVVDAHTKQGWSMGTIAERLGVSRQAVMKRLRVVRERAEGADRGSR